MASRGRRTVAAVLTIVIGPALSVGVAGEAAAVMITGKATYQLSLDTSKTGGLGDVTGELAATLAYECDAYVSESVFSAKLTSVDGSSIPLEIHAAGREEKDTYTFDIVSSLGGKELDRAKGKATRGEGGLTVVSEAPGARPLDLKGEILFPLAATEAAIAAARAGEVLKEYTVFDGSGSGHELWKVSVLIGAAGPVKDEEASLFESGLGFADLQRWRMTFSYFEPSAGDQTAAFSTEAVVYENGFAQAGLYDFGHFALKARLVEFSAIPAKPC